MTLCICENSCRDSEKLSWTYWSTPLSCIFNALFRDTPLGYVQRTLSNGQIAKYGQLQPNMKYLAIWLGELNMAKWNIPKRALKVKKSPWNCHHRICHHYHHHPWVMIVKCAAISPSGIGESRRLLHLEVNQHWLASSSTLSLLSSVLPILSSQ